MRNIVEETARCYREGCGETMEGRKVKYQYVESGLDSVFLKDILVFHCPKCNAIVPRIPAVGVLHRVIALRLLQKKTLLTGKELRYLRKLSGYSVAEFTEIMGTTKQVVSHWENQSNHGQGTDRIVRLLVLGKLIREIIGHPDPILKNVTVEQLTNDIMSVFKTLTKRKSEEQYEISPEEVAHYANTERSERNTEPAVAVM